LRLSALGEPGLLGELERRGLARGLGAEGAVLEDGFVVTQDVLLEGEHFRLGWTSWHDLGYKAAAVNLSDLAALGAEPEGLLVSLGVPSATALDRVVELYEGLNEPGVPVLGGDTAAADRVILAVTALGESERVPGRTGARRGDLLVVTGPLGGSAAGLHALRESLGGFDDLVELHNRPPLRLREGQELARVAHAVVDLSDGIAADAARLAERSGVKLVVEVERLPLAPRLAEVGALPFWTLGEDYELLAALAADDAKASGFPVVGWCEEGSGVEVRLGGEPLEVSGWDSFATPRAGASAPRRPRSDSSSGRR
jgi:thiamine-monophosphate kinase